MRKNNKSLKKIIRMMLVMALAVSITACSGKKDTNDAAVTDTPEVTVTPTVEVTPTEAIPTEEPEVTPEDVENENVGAVEEMTTAEKMHDAFELEEKEVVDKLTTGETGDVEAYHYSIKYPQIKNTENLATIDQVNQLILEEVNQAAEQYMADYADAAKDISEDVLAQSSYSNERTYKVTFNKNYLISIVYTDVHVTGGAYPNVTQTSYTYDLLTGKKLAAVDLMNMTEQEVNDMISESFTTIINEEPDRFYENAREIAVEEAPNAGFYLQDGCLMFYFNEEVLAPHAGGIQEFGSDISSIPETYKEPERLI